MATDYLIDLQSRVRAFVRERDWEQFHTPKNLASALSVEASELLENFLWSPPAPCVDTKGANRERIADEIGDVLIYLVRLADVLELDIQQATDAKLAKNALKYPVELARGKSEKYTDL